MPLSVWSGIVRAASASTGYILRSESPVRRSTFDVQQFEFSTRMIDLVIIRALPPLLSLSSSVCGQSLHVAGSTSAQSDRMPVVHQTLTMNV